MNKLKNFIFYTFLSSMLAVCVYVQYNRIPIWKIFLENNISANNFSLLWNNNKIYVGQVEFVKGDLQRKKHEEYVFETLNKEENVYLKDTFLTDKNTTARIRLKNGSIIELAPNSMVKLDFTENDSFLNISKKPTITVITGSVEEIVKDSSETPIVRIVKKPYIVKKNIELKEIPQQMAYEPPLNYEVLKQQSPKFEFKVEPIKETEQPTRIIASEPIPEPIKVVPIKLHYEVANTSGLTNRIVNQVSNEFWLTLDYKITNNEDNVSYYKVIIYDKLNKQLLLNLKTSLKYVKYDSFILPKQTVFKVKAFNKNDALIGESKVVEFAFDYNPPILKNLNNEKYNILERGLYLLSWESTNFTQLYKIQVAKEKEFNNIVIESDTIKNYYAIKDLNDGSYYIRVKSVNKNFESEWSDYNMFEINHIETLLTKALKQKKVIP